MFRNASKGTSKMMKVKKGSTRTFRMEYRKYKCRKTRNDECLEMKIQKRYVQYNEKSSMYIKHHLKRNFPELGTYME